MLLLARFLCSMISLYSLQYRTINPISSLNQFGLFDIKEVYITVIIQSGLNDFLDKAGSRQYFG